MSYYVAIGGEKKGPFPAYRIIDLLRDGTVTPEALGWEQGMESWKALREIPAFADAIEALERSEEEAEAAGEEVGSADRQGPPPLPRTQEAKVSSPITGLASISTARPFSRLWARVFDYSLVMTIAWQFCEVPQLPKDVSPFDLMRNDGSIISQDAMLKMAMIHYTGLVIWTVLEGLLLHLWGTTPGKALFGMRLSPVEGGRLSLGRAMGRSMLVWILGFGMGLFPFYLIGGVVGLVMLLYNGSTLWDRKFQVAVHHQPFTPGRFLLAVGAFVLIMVLSSLKFS
ncbi:MAG: RDD family protein [Verrucomicrobiae bacterium]|nr:RDD family protein [Verrucomicrobiae bacterium]